jgi:hypothetical protein
MPAPPDTVPAHIVAALGGDPTVPARRIDPADVPAPAPDHPGVSVAPTPRSEPPGADLIDDQVRDLAAAGLGRRRIAAKLGITEHRVRKALAPRADRGK